MAAHTPESLRVAVVNEIGKAGAPGCSIALVEASGLLWADGFGFARVSDRVHATADTVYRLFSGTKLFTATAVLQLEEQGLLGLDDPVESHVPEARAARGVTLLHLLSHRSGLEDTLRGFLAVSYPPSAPPTSVEALAAYRISPARPPAQRVEYRNVNYALLGEVVSRVSGFEYREYVRRRILEPLGMQAAFGLSEAMRSAAAIGTMHRWDPMRIVLRALYPDLPAHLYGARTGRLVELREYDLATSAIGGLVGSMPAFGRFLSAQLAGGGGVLSEMATWRMQAQVAEGKAGVVSAAGVGLGWKIGSVDGRRFLNHEGGGAGFTSELRLYPEQGLAIALAMNAMRMPATMRAAHRICEIVLARAGDLKPRQERAGAES